MKWPGWADQAAGRFPHLQAIGHAHRHGGAALSSEKGASPRASKQKGARSQRLRSPSASALFRSCWAMVAAAIRRESGRKTISGTRIASLLCCALSWVSTSEVLAASGPDPTSPRPSPAASTSPTFALPALPRRPPLRQPNLPPPPHFCPSPPAHPRPAHSPPTNARQATGRCSVITRPRGREAGVGATRGCPSVRRPLSALSCPGVTCVRMASRRVAPCHLTAAPGTRPLSATPARAAGFQPPTLLTTLGPSPSPASKGPLRHRASASSSPTFSAAAPPCACSPPAHPSAPSLFSVRRWPSSFPARSARWRRPRCTA